MTSYPRPWNLSFSFGRALQQSTIKTWAGKSENVQAAQKVFFGRCIANGQASQGKYVAGSEAASTESLFQRNYTY